VIGMDIHRTFAEVVSFSNSQMKRPSPAKGGDLSISISCEANFSFLLLDHVLGCRRSGS